MISPRGGDFVWETSNTAGTSNPFHLLGPVTVGSRTYSKVSEVYADGETVYYVGAQDVSAGVRMIFESGLGTYNLAANTITPTIGRNSSNTYPSGSFVPITWGSGARDIICVPDAASQVTIENIVAVLSANASAVRAALSLGTAALLNVGTGTNNIPQLIGTPSAGNLPAIGGANLTSLPLHAHSAIVIPGLSGGATSRICRSTGATTVTEATAINASGHVSDSADQLRWLVAKGSDGAYYKFGSAPFAGVTAGNHYFLGTLGVVTTTRVSPDGVNSCVYCGYCRVNDVLDVDFKMVVTERLSSGAGLFLDNGNIAVP